MLTADNVDCSTADIGDASPVNPHPLCLVERPFGRATALTAPNFVARVITVLVSIVVAIFIAVAIGQIHALLFTELDAVVLRVAKAEVKALRLHGNCSERRETDKGGH